MFDDKIKEATKNVAIGELWQITRVQSAEGYILNQNYFSINDVFLVMSIDIDRMMFRILRGTELLTASAYIFSYSEKL